MELFSWKNHHSLQHHHQIFFVPPLILDSLNGDGDFLVFVRGFSSSRRRGSARWLSKTTAAYPVCPSATPCVGGYIWFWARKGWYSCCVIARAIGS
ncbi:hypothetical protein MtrunA17_Chr8g0364701 [Medicago truncatula]|uniref:Uncharacterized protein n=1 Tax=Medicago truncatula TaxID=3880 RepID=A0A396GRJ0_MEDTR|nr:hypothetical protein MtrunA17_Chr8g0364701 [Medicago truncatula]